MRYPKNRKSRAEDLTGRRFGRYVVVRRVTGSGSLLRWLCRCDCGTEKEVLGCHLRSGRIVSCGCWAADKARGRARHGLSNSATYRAWRSMLSRCFRENDTHYKHYGARGITVCNNWRHSFDAFLADMGQCPPGLSLERDNNDGNYQPGNCRWATKVDQANNKRSNIRVRYAGECMTLKQLSQKCEVNYKALYWRVRIAKWPIEKAVSQCVR